MLKKRVLGFFIGAIIGVALSFVGIAIFKKPVKPSVAPPPVVEAPAVIEEKAPQLEFQKGISYVAWTKEGYRNANSIKSMRKLVSLGVEWICLITIWYQDRFDSTEIYPLNDKTPSDDSLLFAIRELHDLKFKIMLKPHLDLVESEGKWRGDIGFENLSDWQAWFDSYSDFILHYASLAEQENVELFCIGTELSNAALTQPELWRDLIRKVREIYKGQLIYAANWYKEFDGIEFWDELDYAGIDPYFPLVGSLRPTVEELKEAWEDWLQIIQSWQKDVNKPVILTEIGYKSSVGATDEPWQHSPIGEVDLQLQANSYEALLASFWDKPWFYGVYWWYWGVNPKMGGEFHRGFTPQNKPAQEVIKQWYKKSAPKKAY